ncbi:MAG: gamma-glutamyl-gamma-aminobutyrate hydrolase [Legionellales bacterium RIFCSPHIGHO2_12_FULL_37_14]|nr:MAG: gamma-glutamyl-gamma-aminobutyrate hydrolase [Legionellales bacterium RIFCSPHIGHO2_12_FULL_37_14]
MRLVAISQRVEIVESRKERQDVVDQRLAEFVQYAGYLPVAIPNTLATFDNKRLHAWLEKMEPSAVLLSGGNDIGADAPERDATEQYLLSWAFMHKLPVLGICRGMQMMGRWAGVELKKTQGHVSTFHRLQGVLNGIVVNSYHNFSLATCPDGFKVLAQSEDGEIEAIGHLALPWQGWMWHPERDIVFSEQNINLIKHMFR